MVFRSSRGVARSTKTTMNMKGRSQNPPTSRRSVIKRQGRSKLGNRLLSALCMLECTAVCHAASENPLAQTREVTVKLYTDNLNHISEKPLETHLEALANHAMMDRPDILVFGFQEARYNKLLGKEGDLATFNFIGEFLTKHLNDVGGMWGEIWTHVDSSRVPSKPGGNILIGLMDKGIYVYVFSNGKVSFEETQIIHRRFGKKGKGRGTLSNKGCVAVNCHTDHGRMTFLCCHNSSDSLALNTTDFRECEKVACRYESDVTFMIGDFNPRVKSEWREFMGMKKSDKWCKKGTPTQVKKMNSRILELNVEEDDIPRGLDTLEALKRDQYGNLKWKEHPFSGPPPYISEKNGPAINLQDPETVMTLDQYHHEASKNRIISYCDRILYDWKEHVSIRGVRYGGIYHIKDLNQSDHRVVYGVYKMTFPAGSHET